jgi:hypothetical protein
MQCIQQQMHEFKPLPSPILITHYLGYIILPGTYMHPCVRPDTASLTHMQRSSQCTDRHTAILPHEPVHGYEFSNLILAPTAFNNQTAPTV